MTITRRRKRSSNVNYEFNLMQLSDSFFPSGMFGMSAGLESLVKYNKIKDDKDVLKFINQQLCFQIVPCDCIVTIIAMDAVYNNNILSAVDIDKIYYSMKLVKEVRIASTRSGQQILNCILQMSNTVGEDRMIPSNILQTDEIKRDFVDRFLYKIQTRESAGTYPVCFGIAASCLGLPKKSSIRIMMYSYSVSIIGAAVRMGIIQHLDGQKILAAIGKTVNTLSESVNKKSIIDIWQLNPLTEIFQMIHEREDSRMFIT